MNLTFKNETFRDDYTFKNSPESIRRFPFPFNEDKYMYSVNMEPHVPAGPAGHAYNKPIDVDEHYVAEMRDRALVLKDDPSRDEAKIEPVFTELIAEHTRRMDRLGLTA